MEHCASFAHDSEPKTETGMTPSTLLLEQGDLDLPIALRKGVRSCTQHPISHYVSYDCLSLVARAFVTNGFHRELKKL